MCQVVHNLSIHCRRGHTEHEIHRCQDAVYLFPKIPDQVCEDCHEYRNLLAHDCDRCAAEPIDDWNFTEDQAGDMIAVSDGSDAGGRSSCDGSETSFEDDSARSLTPEPDNMNQA